jgi:hypothetical protein
MPSAENSPKSQKTKLAIAIANGVKISKWASDNQVPHRTAYRWANDPKVRAKVELCRSRALDRAIGQMAHNVNFAAEGINTLARGAVSESVKLAALRSIFSNMMAVTEFADLQVRMTQLEEQLDERARAGNTGQTG